MKKIWPQAMLAGLTGGMGSSHREYKSRPLQDRRNCPLLYEVECVCLGMGEGVKQVPNRPATKLWWGRSVNHPRMVLSGTGSTDELLHQVLPHRCKAMLNLRWSSQVNKGFPSGSGGWMAPANAEMWLRTLARKIPWRRKCQTTLVFLMGKCMGQRSLACSSLWGSQRFRDNWATEHAQWSEYSYLSFIDSLRCSTFSLGIERPLRPLSLTSITDN